MSEVTAFERFEDAVDTRAKTLNAGMDYKAGLLIGFVKAMAETYPEVRGQMVSMTTLLEQWNAEHESERRAENAEVDGYC